MIGQITRRVQVLGSRNPIWAKQKKAPTIGTNGTSGVLNSRGTSGRVARSTITLIQTITKASKVPIETNSLSTPIGKRPAKVAATIPVTAVVTCGVLKVEWTFVKTLGNSPSTAIR